MRIKEPGLFQSSLFIINPQKSPAGSRRLKRALREASAARVEESKNGEHFRELVRDFYSSGYEHLIIYGGDGSIHTAMNEAMKYGRSPSSFPADSTESIVFEGNGVCGVLPCLPPLYTK